MKHTRTIVTEDGWRQAIDRLANGSVTLLGLWGDAPRVYMAVLGLEAVGSPDTRPWLDLGRWEVRHPLGAREPAQKPAPYAFLPVEGEALHQIAVGPVHAGIIEPGHFRFTANGEHLVRLEQRLGYVHKGIESLMQGATLEAAAKLAGRTSGDSTVAYAFAFAPSSNAWPIISATSARSATTPRSH